MKNFDDLICSHLNESIVDIPRNSLDTSVWEFPEDRYPIIHPIIKTQIENDMKDIQDKIKVSRVYIMGSITTNRYSSMSDIDVNVQVKSQNELEKMDVLDVVKRINGRLATGTTHPINYYIFEGDYDYTKVDGGVYQLDSERWLKDPKIVKNDMSLMIKKYNKSINNVYLETEELRRDILDLEELKSLSKDEVSELQKLVDNKMAEIEADLEEILNTYSHLKQARKIAYNKQMTPEDIRKFGRKNKLPENVIFKLVEKYYFGEFVAKIKEIYSDHDLNDADIKKIKKAGKELWGK